jgi:adenylate cyclase
MIEIERKYLVDTDVWQPMNNGVHIVQGYLSVDPERVVRVRIKSDKAFLTIKGKTKGISRIEMEYEIPVTEALTLLEMAVFMPIKKVRYLQQIGDLLWEIDVFNNENEGLVLAEVELPTENTKVILPGWVTQEVSGDPRYYNAWLTQHPFKSWK